MKFHVATKRGKIALLIASLALPAALYSAYSSWHQHRLLSQGRIFLQNGDLAAAGNSCRNCLLINSNNLAGLRLMADICDKARSSHVLEWRRRIAKLDSSHPARSQLELASSALRLGDFSAASQALNVLRRQTSPEFHALAAALSLATNNLSEAVTHLEQAVKLSPGNDGYRCNLAILQLKSENSHVRERAEMDLRNFPKDSLSRPAALRSLISVGLQRGDSASALPPSIELANRPDALLEDLLAHLDLLGTNQGLFLSQCQTRAQANPLLIPGLAHWMVERNLGENCFLWLSRLPERCQTNTHVRLVRAECAAVLGHWDFLARQSDSWDGGEFLRHAFLSLAQGRTGKAKEGQDNWKKALETADGNATALKTLSNFSDHWGMHQEHEEALWRFEHAAPGDPSTLQRLEQIYARRRHTEGLFKVFQALLQRGATNLLVKNNFCTVAFLVSQDVGRAHAFADELQARGTDHPGIATTVAYSLHLRGRTHDGLELLKRLRSDQLSASAVACYHGVLLVAAGQWAEAKEALEKARQGVLLPEEEALVSQAWAVVGQTSRR